MQLIIKCDCSSGHLQFNARSETVAEKSVFSRLLARQRCVVLFNGFYEWKKVRLWNSSWSVFKALLYTPSGQCSESRADCCACMQEGSRKQPFYVNVGEGNIMRMAGLFDTWSGGADDAPLYTYTIMTTDSSKRLQW